MLWSLPARAQPPIVSGRNRTFAASRISLASARVIQSDAAGAIDQSPDDAVVDELSVDPLESEPVEPGPDPLSDALPPVLAVASSFFAALDRADVERSFFAQPDPLKWIAGVVNAFVIVPSAPHSGQNLGPWSWIPWTTSVRWPQALHV
jgi:hypothetical protein